MDIEHCLIVQMDAEFARFEHAADKTLTQRLFNMSVARPQTHQYECDAWKRRPLGLRLKRQCKNTFFCELRFVKRDMFFRTSKGFPRLPYPFTNFTTPQRAPEQTTRRKYAPGFKAEMSKRGVGAL